MKPLGKIYNPKKIIHATVEFTDIAGLVRGASKGEGLGNKFLGQIRQTAAIIHVVRCFEDDNVTHVEGSVNPIRDAEKSSIHFREGVSCPRCYERTTDQQKASFAERQKQIELARQRGTCHLGRSST